MKEIFESQLHLENIGNYDKDTFSFTLEKGVFNTREKKLNVKIKLNFIVPLEDEKRIKSLILNRAIDIKKVDFEYSYENIFLKEKDIIRLFLPYLIGELGGAYSIFASDIRKENIIIEGQKVVIKVFGELACKMLNEKAAKVFSDKIFETFRLDYEFLFKTMNEAELLNRENNYYEEDFISEDYASYEGNEDFEVFEEKEKAKFDDQNKPKSRVRNDKNDKKVQELELQNPDIEDDYEKNFLNDVDKISRSHFEKNNSKDKEEKKDSSRSIAKDGKEYKNFRRGKKDLNEPAKGNILVGKSSIKGEKTDLSKLKVKDKVVVEGVIFDKEARKLKTGSVLATIYITDYKTSIPIKAFLTDEKWEELKGLLKDGTFIRVFGNVEFDTYIDSLTIKFSGIEKKKREKRKDTYEGKKRVELHAHTKMSAMDGLNEVEDLVKTSAMWGQPAVAITDHGVVQGFPDAAKIAKKLGSDKENPINIKVIYGMEGYVFDDEGCYDEKGNLDYKKKKTNHIILLAKTQEGLKNLYKLVSMSHLDYFYRKPRLPKSKIKELREGLIIGSACEAGEVFQGVLHEIEEEKLLEIAEFYDYLEIQPIINNQFLIDNGLARGEEDLRNLNRKVLELGRKLDKLVVATTDAHYDEPNSALYRNILMAGMGYKDAENGRGLYMRTTDEMMEEFSYLGDDIAYEVVIENSNKIADMIEEGISPVPKGKFPPKISGAEDTLRKTCMEKAHSIYGNPLPDVIEERLEKELNSIIGNGYAVMYVSAQMLVQKSLEDGYLVGSRGSVGSSFAATMAGITEVNPLDPHYICPSCQYLEWGDMNEFDCGIDMQEKNCPRCGKKLNRDGFTIPFATFLGFDGDKEPDIDLNFAGEYQGKAHKYVGEIFGEKNVFKAGTVSTVADKTAYGYVKNFYKETNIPVNNFEINRLTKRCTGVKKTTGQHPGGIIIVPEDHDIYEFCPVQRPANDVTSDIITTHFDYHKIDENLLKLDILGHNVPSMIRQLQDLTGVDPLNVDLTDRKVLSIFNGTKALDIKDEDYEFTHGSYAIPEFGTSFVRNMLDDTKPDKFADLVRISGFSHGTDVWLNNAQEYIRSGTATMREVISTRDDIMNYLILKGLENKTAFQIMEDVRKNIPLKEEQLKVMEEHNVPSWYVDSCIKIQYMFPRAHAVAYVMMSFRLAWYKVYYPKEFYATYFTSYALDFDLDTILKGKKAVLEKIKDIDRKDKNASQKEKATMLVLEVAYEMMSRGYYIEKPSFGKSLSNKFTVIDGKIVPPFITVDNLGEKAAVSLIEAYEEEVFGSIEDAITRGKINKAAVEGLTKYGLFAGLPQRNQLSFLECM